MLSRLLPVHIKELRLQNFKSFEDFTIEFSDFNVLVGINNSGKTTILQGIRTCFYFLSEIISNKNKIKKGDKRVLPDLTQLNFYGHQELWHNNKMRSAGHYIPIIFSIKFSNGIHIEFKLGERYGQTFIEISDISKELTKSEVSQLLENNPHLIQGFIGVLPFEEFKTNYGVRRAITTGRHSEVLRNTLLLLRLRSAQKFNALNSILERYFGVNMIKNSINKRFQENVSAVFQDKNAKVDISLGGSGFLQILQLLTFILTSNTKIIMLDEPDAHLHPSLQSVLLQILRDLSQHQNYQFIIATHSKEIVTHTDPRNIIHISSDNKEGKKISSYPELINILGELGSIDNIDLALLMKTKKCLFVEGKEDKILKVFASKLGIQMFQINQQVVVISRNGTDNIRYYDDLNVFRSFIGSDLKAYSIIDRDVKTDERVADIIQNAQKKNVMTHIWSKNEIENYLLIPSLLERTINSMLVQKGLDPLASSDIIHLIDECADELKENVTDLIAKEIVDWNSSQKIRIELPEANTQSRTLVSTKWTNTENKLSIVPGKELLSKINQKIQSKHGISMNFTQLANEIETSEIDEEIKHVLEQVKSM